MPQPNVQLRARREATPSPRVPGACLSRAELAQAVNEWVETHTKRHGALDGYYVARLEAGKVRWPGREYRAGFRAVLDATTDAELGFWPSNAGLFRRCRPNRPPLVSARQPNPSNACASRTAPIRTAARSALSAWPTCTP